MWRQSLLAAVGLLALTTPGAGQTELRLASWNIANFTHIEGIEHRPGIGTKRFDADFAALKRYADGLDADVVALQEIGTVEAARLLFPAPGYTVYPSEHLANVPQGQNEGDIYTAIAVRNRPDLSVVRQEDLNELAIIHPVDNHPVRSGAALLLNVGGEMIWVMSVHLKSSCSSIKNVSGSTNPDCATFWRQRIPLRGWIAEREADDEAFVIMGDFNRQFRRFGPDDQFWQALSADGASQPDIVAHPLSVTRLCPTRLGASTQPIDWILLSESLVSRFTEGSYWETRYSNNDVETHGGRSGTRLSDHCPIKIDLTW